MINPDLFQCTLYVARIVSNKFNKTPESYYVVDYLLKAKAGDSNAFLRGGDYCFLLCTFFPERGRRRMIDSKYYLSMGKQMYLNFYYETQKTIGVNMHNNFCSMIKLVREVFN